MAYLSRDALEAMGFSALGQGVKISDKAAIYEPHRMHLGDHVRIDDFCVVSGAITMGRNVYVGPGSLLAGGRPGLHLADFVTLAYHVKIFTQSDDYTGATMTNSTVPAPYKDEVEAPVTLGRHAIVGAGSTVLPGCDLAEGTSVGAMALVTRPTQAWSIYAGVPARRVRDRSRNLLALEKAYLAEDGA